MPFAQGLVIEDAADLFAIDAGNVVGIQACVIFQLLLGQMQFLLGIQHLHLGIVQACLGFMRVNNGGCTHVKHGFGLFELALVEFF